MDFYPFIKSLNKWNYKEQHYTDVIFVASNPHGMKIGLLTYSHLIFEAI